MKRTTLTLLSLIMTVIMMAGNVTPEEAMLQAQNFLLQHESISSKARKAPGTTTAPRLTMVKQLKGVYLFNVEDDGGYVIVSSDDRTLSILGYSDSGAIDPDNIPANMQAWLQGYADEIEWMQQHNSITINDSIKKLPRRAPIAQTDIAPLVTTTWNQGAPYNNMCPEFSSGNRSATGCVATAMAQVMNYHQWPTTATTAIPGYTSMTYDLDLTAGLPATTFDWANMQDSYSENATGATADAVATLMQYCGYSVQMDYGPSSGSNTDLVATALKDYFDYKTTTTQFVSRSFYTATKWANLIYHELANNRPVVYGGMSSGGGHEFVCDGYKYENNTDFFHINWGWGGTSDNYFVLSALDPDQQGIGGSTSDDGFHYGQDAVIGIQPSTGTGTIANITPNVINLTVNSMTPSANPAYYGTTVNITLNVTNNSADDYDGDIYLGNKYVYQGSEEFEIIDGSNYTIASGETKDIVIPFRPYATGTYNLVYFLPNATGSYETTGEVFATLTVENPVTSEVVPVYGHYCDELSRSLFVIPSTDLEEMTNGTLNGVTFYSTDTSADWGDAEFDVYLSETTNTTISAFTGWSSLTKVYSGSLSITGGEMTIIFDTPFTYGGSNLMVGINQTKSGDYDGCHWVGSTVSGASYGGYNISLSQQNFLPNTTFDYTPGEAPAVARPTGLTIKYTGGTTAEASWTSTESAWDIDVNGTITENVTNPYTLTNLELATVYTAKVRAKNDSEVSDWSAPVTFTTDLSDELCQIGFELTDSENDGWNGASIQVVDVITGIVIGTVTNSDGNGKTQTLSMTVPDNRDINFVWVSGSYDDECSYVVCDVNGEQIFSGSDAMSSIFTYHVDCTYTAAPTDLSVVPYPTYANVDWTGNDAATSYDLRYAAVPNTGFGSGWLQYDNDSYHASIGNSSSYTWTWGVMYPAVTGSRLTKVSFYEISKYNTADITVSIYDGEDAPNETPLYTEVVTPMGSNGFHEVTLATPVSITPGKNLWIALTTTGTYVIPYCYNDEPNNNWVYSGGTLAHIGDLSSSLAGCGWMIRGYFESDADIESLSWTNATTSDTSYTINSLTAETTYVVQVRGDYGSDGKGNWAAAIFTTPSTNDVPVSLTATDIADNGAALAWTGYQDSYNLRYRVANGYAPVWADDFENGLGNWTLYTENEGNGWVICNPASDGLGIEAHSGNNVASSWSWNNDNAYNVDNWLVSPLLDLQGSLIYWVGTSSNYPDYYEVKMSTAGNAVADFSDASAVTLKARALAPTTGSMEQVIIDLSDYEGQQGYIAIHHDGYDNNFLLIDDFGIYNAVAQGEWQTTTADQPSLVLTGLAPGTPYEWQVQGILTSGTTAWSDLATFTTTGEYVGITNLTVDDGKGKATANGTWYDLSGRPVKSPTQRGIYIRDGKKYVVK